MTNYDNFPASKQNLENLSFKKTIKYLKDKFAELENDYSKDGEHSESCGLIAIEVAKLIIAEGGHPQLLSIRGEKVDLNNTETIEPKRYSGRIKWGGHTVCENDSIIYDPMIGEPEEKEIYLKTAFLKPVEAKVEVSQNEISRFIQR